ncbi:SDR family NAD(P)-dependent oxidoreductase [Robertmurraya korlensis]|uniref:SDR family NAD(P)-dependent oxidoreductase n=1 Tax=Robertmurraya korlensis TaxID=519977 RepID=UPI000A46BA39|nr:SDR family NAD(P)-dependent oxidoreductase [Robertmurraya korlensis]
MKKALVLGATGGMGFALVEELVSRGIETTAFARSSEKLVAYKQEWGHLAKTLVGDVMNEQSLSEAVKSVDLVFHSINIPYEKWNPALFRILEAILIQCKSHKKPIIYVDNIYSYGRQSNPVSEDTPRDPHTKKGNIRLQLQNQIQTSTVPYIIAHFPDFYGPKAESTILQYTFKQMLKKQSAGFVGHTKLPREFIYTKDGAKALVELALREDCYNQSWNISGAGTISGEEIAAIASRFLDKPLKVKPIGRRMIAALGLFNPSMREVTEMMYLNETPVILDSSKYEALIGPLPRTPYHVGVVENLKELAK